MNLKNYTSSTPAHQTIAFIEAYLADCGVSGISKAYDNGQPSAIFFHIEVGGKKFSVRLPARIAEVHDFLWNDYVTSRSQPRKTKEDFLDQAVRTAWKIQQDWVQVQMSLIKLKQADFLEVFMGFIWDGKQSYYQRVEKSGFRALIPEKVTNDSV